MTPERYRLAGADLLANAGPATRPPPVAQEWLAPVGLRAVDDGIEWQPRRSLERGGVIVPSEGLLEDLLTLRDAAPADVLNFAEVHGVLGLATGRHHRRGEYAHESLQAWREAAHRAQALVTAAARLRQGGPLSDDERVPVLAAAWPDIEPPLTYPLLTDGGELASVPFQDEATALREELLLHCNRTLEDDRTQLAWAVSTWMAEAAGVPLQLGRQAGAQLVLAWPSGESQPVLTIGGERAMGCLPAVTVQVALACARADTTRPCDGCGRLHAPRRHPKPGARSFCQRCREAGVPLKLAKRDSRARKRAEVEAQDG